MVESQVEERLAAHPLVPAVREALRRVGVSAAWLVGGAVRDAAAGASRGGARDLDLALPGSGEAAARAVASILGGTAFALDASRGAWRVACAGGRTVDVVPLRAPDLPADLRGRDFTVNAVAFDLLGGEGIVDPLGGLADLAGRRLATCSPRSLADDPLRVLRAYRFAAALSLELADGLRDALGRAAPGLGAVAPERVRAELFALLVLPQGARALRRMAEEGVLEALFPSVGSWRGFDQGDYHAHDLLEHSLRAAEAAEDLAADPAAAGLPEAARLAAHLAEELEAGVGRGALLKLAALLHDVAKPDTLTLDGARRRFLGHEVQGGHRVRRLLAGLRLGRRSRAAAQRLVAAHLRLYGLAHQTRPTRAARLRYLRDLGSETPEAVLLSLADERATGPEPRCLEAVLRVGRELLTLYWERSDRREIPPLLRGRDLVAELGLAEGPRVGDLLRRVGEAEVRGEVSTKAEALALARTLAETLGR